MFESPPVKIRQQKQKKWWQLQKFFKDEKITKYAFPRFLHHGIVSFIVSYRSHSISFCKSVFEYVQVSAPSKAVSFYAWTGQLLVKRWQHSCETYKWRWSYSLTPSLLCCQRGKTMEMRVIPIQKWHESTFSTSDLIYKMEQKLEFTKSKTERNKGGKREKESAAN